MSFLKGNYAVKQPESAQPQKATDSDDRGPLEQEYYKAALSKLGGSIAFVMKGRTFLWQGDAHSKEDNSPKK